MKKYQYVKYALCDGWGCEGVFPKDAVDNAPREKIGNREAIILNINDMIVGSGQGWEDTAILDEEWLTKACELMNKYEEF